MPLIKNIPDSAHIYLSNVIFGANLAFSDEEGVCFWKKIYLDNWTSRGINSGVTQFHTHVSRQFWALSIKQNKKLWKIVLKMWSQICGYVAMLVHKITFKKMQKRKKYIKLKNLKPLFFYKAIFWRIMPFYSKFETTFSNQF